MSNLLIGLIVFIIVFGSAMVGVISALVLPEHHVSAKVRRSVNLSAAIVGTLSALVLGLMISTASHSYSQRVGEVEAISVDLIGIDQLLHRYGPDADVARADLRAWAVAKEQEMFPKQGRPPLSSDVTIKLLATLQDAILALTPTDPRHTFLRSQAITLSVGLTEARWLLVQQSGSNIPVPFLILLIFWLAVVFASFGLFTPLNGTTIVVLLLCSAAVSGGIAMILELDSPFSGLVHISPEPMRHALQVIDY